MFFIRLSTLPNIFLLPFFLPFTSLRHLTSSLTRLLPPFTPLLPLTLPTLTLPSPPLSSLSSYTLLSLPLPSLLLPSPPLLPLTLLPLPSLLLLLSGKTATRLAGQDAEFDVFLSYRVDADCEFVDTLYRMLLAGNVRFDQ